MKAKFLIFFLTLAPFIVSAQINYGISGGMAYVYFSPFAPSNAIIAATYQGVPVTSIASNAFTYVSSIRSVIMPDSITNIANGAFMGCPNLQSVVLSTNLTSIGTQAFSGSSLTNIAIPGSIINIGLSAFRGCVQLASVTISNGVSIIGMEAFDSCYALTNLNLPATITTIGQNAFTASGIISAIIPAAVTNIGLGAFVDCLSITNFSVEAGNPNYSSVNGVLFDKQQTVLIDYPSGSTILGYAIPDSVTNIETYAFEHCVYLANVSVPNSVTIVGDNIFYDCKSLTNISLSDNLTNLGYEMFNSCSKLTGVTIPRNIVSIPPLAFSGCGLTNLTIQNTIKAIGAFAFSGCAGLTSATIPDSVTNLDYGVFGGCPLLTNITVISSNPNFSSAGGVLFDKNQASLLQYPAGLSASYVVPVGVTDIASYAFDYCTKLTNVTLPPTLLNIGGSAFYGCTGLRKVIIPGNLSNIDYTAFSICNNLTNITFTGNAPVVLGYGSLSVPAKVYYYYGTTGWGGTFGGLATVEIFPPLQIGEVRAMLAGGQSGNFGFTITGVSGQSVVVEGSTNLSNWQPIWTNTISGTMVSFSDPQWTNYSARYYRAR